MNRVWTAEGRQDAPGEHARSMLRGTASGLEFVFTDRPFDDAWTEMEARLAERPDFYRGSRATAIFADTPPDDALGTFLAGIAQFQIDLLGVFGSAGVEALAQRHGVAYLGAPERPAAVVATLERKRAAKARPSSELTERARSLDADFAGARAEIASRRARGEASVRRPDFTSRPDAATATAARAPLAAVEPAPSTLYHRGTLRGGQSLTQLGTIVVVGDVNPGAELTATGDIVVFGALRGTAHAGAQGDEEARVIALDLRPTQLRIGTLIAADDGGSGPAARGPEIALVENGRIAVAKLEEVRN